MWKLVILILFVTADGEVITKQSEVKGLETQLECDQMVKRIVALAGTGHKRVVRWSCEQMDERQLGEGQ